MKQMNSKSKNPILNLLGIKAKRPNPIQWRLTSKKTGTATYKIQIKGFIERRNKYLDLKAMMSKTPYPVLFDFEDNPAVLLIGDTIETGALKEDLDKPYNALLNIIQDVLVLRSPTMLKGSIFYMAYTNNWKIQPKEIELRIELN